MVSNIPLYICTTSSLSISLNGHFGCFHVLALVNLQWTLGCMYLFESWFFSRYRLRSGSAGSYGSFSCRFLRTFHAVLRIGCTNLHSHLQCRRVPLSSHPLQHLLFEDYFADGHSGWCEVIAHFSFDLQVVSYSEVDHLLKYSRMDWITKTCCSQQPYI